MELLGLGARDRRRPSRECLALHRTLVGAVALPLAAATHDVLGGPIVGGRVPWADPQDVAEQVGPLA